MHLSPLNSRLYWEEFMNKDDLFHLPVKIGNVELRNPFIVASGPTAKRIDQLELAEKCGWGAASIKQTFNPRSLH